MQLYRHSENQSVTAVQVNGVSTPRDTSAVATELIMTSNFSFVASRSSCSDCSAAIKAVDKEPLQLREAERSRLVANQLQEEASTARLNVVSM